MNAIEQKIHAMPEVANEPGESRRALANLRELELRRQDAVNRLAAHRQARNEAAYDSVSAPPLSPGGRHLTRLRRDTLETQSEIEDIDAALAVATEKLQIARERAAAQQRRGDAEEAVSISSEMFDQAQLCGECVTALVARVRRFQELADQAHRRGFGASPALIAANLRRALGNSLHALGLGDLVPVSQRVEPGSLLANYAARVADDARRELGESEAA